MQKILASCLFSLLLSGCGYRFGGGSEPISVNIPFVIEDMRGTLTAALVEEVSRSPMLHFDKDAPYILDVEIVDNDESEIGYQYQTENDGERINRLSSTENRRELTLKCALIHKVTKKALCEEFEVNVELPYDYVDNRSLNDLSYLNATGARITSLNTSLGQLDAKENAQTVSQARVYKMGAKRLVQSLESSLLLNQ